VLYNIIDSWMVTYWHGVEICNQRDYSKNILLCGKIEYQPINILVCFTSVVESQAKILYSFLHTFYEAYDTRSEEGGEALIVMLT